MYENLKRGDTAIIVGPHGVGRTGYALNLARAALEDGGVVLFIDAGGDIPAYQCADLAGNPDFALACPTSIEEAYTLIRQAVMRGVDMVILDGVDRLSTRKHFPGVGEASIRLMKTVEIVDAYPRTTAVFLVQSRRGFSTIAPRLVEESTTRPLVRVQLTRGATPGTADVVVNRDDTRGTFYHDGVPVTPILEVAS